MKYSVFLEAPEGFNASLEAAGCYCYCEDKLLFLKRHPEKSQGNTWGVPGGKIEPHEDPRMAVIREIREEVGLNIDDESLTSIGHLYCRLPHVDYVFHLFQKPFETMPEIDLSLDEHLEFMWVTFEDASALPLIAGGSEALSYFKRNMLG